VQVNMLDAIVALQMQELSVYTVAGKPQQRSAEPHAHVYIRAPYGVFKTKDSYLALAFPKMAVLAQVIGAPELAQLNDEGDTFTHRDMIYATTRERLLLRTTAEWLAAFEAADAWAGPVYGYADVVNDPQIQHNGTFVEYEHPTEGRIKTPGFPIRFTKTPSRVQRGAPLAGQHTREILSELGWSTDRIDTLMQAKVIGEDQP
jgi:crotonobetainyl-CoA:carnitine CoA-transferase CaiB-like acyl-CoA transferase